MRIDIDDVDVDMDEGQRYLYRDEPFTGELYETDRHGTVIASFGVLRGVRHGRHREWFPDGTLRIETMVVDGSAVDVSREWHRNGALAVEREFDDRGDLVAVRRWAEDGSPLASGRPAGHDTA
jgi:antitoxin component YwqK of YwqJK toxin-antitoxin module